MVRQSFINWELQSPRWSVQNFFLYGSLKNAKKHEFHVACGSEQIIASLDGLFLPYCFIITSFSFILPGISSYNIFIYIVKVVSGSGLQRDSDYDSFHFMLPELG